jgi:hypothetical protein
MTPRQCAQLDRATAIAARDRLTATPGEPAGWWIVPSRSQSRRAGTTRYHILRVVGRRIQCDCPAAAWRVCAHRAAVHAALVAALAERATSP